MTWSFLNNKTGQGFVLSFSPEKVSSGTRVNFDIYCDEKSLKTLSPNQQKLFHKATKETELQQAFRKCNCELPFVYSLFEHIEDGAADESEELNFVHDDQKLVCEGTPTKMPCEDLNAIIKTQKVILYTGAGISAAAVPAMGVLMSRLGMSEGLKEDGELQHYISDVINNPEKYTEILRDFFDCCENAQPTTAHVLLSECARRFNHLLVTENVDQLHQNSGMEPIVFAGSDRYSDDEKIIKATKESDFIVTIGLNSDESAFLNFYKTQNPQGRIISVNLTQTNYLSDADFFVEGDIQKIAEKIFQ